jgi:hypothetical protein
MIASALIIVCSAVLLVYWFRYSCLLLLRNASAQTEGVSSDERFHIGMVLDRAGTETDLTVLERALNRDYQLLSYLLKHAADLELASIENRMLILDYKVMRLCFRLTRIVAPPHSRKALVEMATALSAVARQAGQQSEEAA